jgi:hypothetical protein
MYFILLVPFGVLAVPYWLITAVEVAISVLRFRKSSR